MHLPEDRVAFIKEDISVERKSGEMMEALMGLFQHKIKPTHPRYRCRICICQYAVS